MNRDEIETILVQKYGFSGEAVKMGVHARFKCEYCNRDLLKSVNDYDAWHKDHIVPVSKGGSGDFGNLALACKTCNFIKSNWLSDNSAFLELSRKQKISIIEEYITKKRAIKYKKLAEIRDLANELIA